MNKDEQWLLKEKYGGVESEAFHADCKRLAGGEPLGYVIGFVPFLDCKIWLDSKPLIPRPETEFWVEKAIETIQNSLHPRVTLGDSLGLPSGEKAQPPRVLDLCAGSGCIGVAVAHHVPGAIVYFAELEPAHLPTIGKNLSENQIACTEYRVWQSDLFNGLPKQYPETKKSAVLDELRGTGEFPSEPYQVYGEEEIGTRNKVNRQNSGLLFDFILSNPPYVDRELNRVEKSVSDFEPAAALYGGRGGLQLIEHIITAAPAQLNPQGQLWLEHEPEQTDTISKLATEYGFSVTVHTDQYGVHRYSVLVLE